MAAPVLGVLHGLEGHHHYCPEHHAFEETTARGKAPGDVPGCTSQDARSATTHGGGEHEICAFGKALQRNATTPSDCSWAVAADLHHTAAPALSSIDTRPIALLSIAPKSSPPTALT